VASTGISIILILLTNPEQLSEQTISFFSANCKFLRLVRIQLRENADRNLAFLNFKIFCGLKTKLFLENTGILYGHSFS